MTFEEQARALVAVKLLTAIRQTRPHLHAAIQEFALHEFPGWLAVSQKDELFLNLPNRLTECAGEAIDPGGNKPAIREKVA